ncbi:Pol polyprotein [Elysia marginata]|uniref:Pol polyprotein n=1 Tax=Elysia marginata TaxID=1093978 RepID=A0AAV4IMY9_9GAST|nr:Pol polyprotein [Elysia marginata]
MRAILVSPNAVRLRRYRYGGPTSLLTSTPWSGSAAYVLNCDQSLRSLSYHPRFLNILGHESSWIFSIFTVRHTSLLVDHSHWPEIRILDRLTSAAAIVRLKSIFATRGIQEVLVSDNGPQFASAEFRKFTEEFSFTHTTSSPRYPQANGEAERAAQTIKNLLRKATDPYRSLHVKHNLPLLIEKEQRYRDNQRDNYNRHNAVQKAPELQPGDAVYIEDLKRPRSIINRHPNPRSYIVNTEQGTIRRNCAHLVATPTPARSPQAPTPSVPEAPFRPPSVHELFHQPPARRAPRCSLQCQPKSSLD